MIILDFFAKKLDEDFTFYRITFRDGETTVFLEEVRKSELCHFEDVRIQRSTN